MTNYEHAKNLSVKELAEWMNGGCEYCAYYYDKNIDCSHNKALCCIDGIEKWLKSEVEE